MLISCSGHQPQKLNIHRRETYYTIPRHNWSEAAQGMHGWGEAAFAVCLGSQRDSAWGRPSTEQYENHLFPFLSSHFWKVLLEALFWSGFQLWQWGKMQPFKQRVLSLMGLISASCPLGDGAKCTGFSWTWAEICSLLAQRWQRQSDRLGTFWIVDSCVKAAIMQITLWSCYIRPLKPWDAWRLGRSKCSLWLL